MSYKILTEFPQDFINLLDDQSRHPNMVMKYATPIEFGNNYGFQFQMCNGDKRVNYFKDQEKNIFSKKGSELAPIILFQKEKSKTFKRIYFSEGESDAMALAVHSDSIIIMPGANSCTSIVKNRASLLEYLPLHSYEFCILFDNDLAGQKGAEELEQILLDVFPNSSVAIFDWIGLKAKDLRESLVSGELNFEKLNNLLDKQSFKTTTDLLLDELTQPEKMIKCPLDYDEETETLVWSTRGEKQEIIFESSEVLKLTTTATSTFKFLDISNANSLEFIDTELLKKQSRMKWSNNTLLNDLNVIISKHVSMPKENVTLVSCYIILSYLYPIFKRIPYLYLNGMKGSGKSTLSELIAMFSFNGEHLACPTPASTRRLIHATRGLVSLDDAENLSTDNEDTKQFRGQLNSGYLTRAITLLCDKENEQKQLFIGGPKVFNSINGLENVLGSRAIYLKMNFATNFQGEKLVDKSNSVVKFYRTSGIIFALLNHQKIKELSNGFNFSSSRDTDLILPLISIAKFFDDLNEYKTTFQSHIETSLDVSKELKSNKWTFEMCLIDSLYSLWKSGGSLRDFEIFNTEIKVDLYSYDEEAIPKMEQLLKTKIGEMLNSLDLFSDMKRTKEKSLKKGSKYKIKTELLESLHKRLIPIKKP